jgi:hypothetical protein
MNRLLVRATVAVALSLAFSVLLSSRWLTPVLVMGDAVNPWAKWLVAGAQLVVLGLLVLSATYRFACALGIGFGLSNLVALSLNFLSALMFWGWDSESRVQGGLLIAFLIAQIVAVVAARRALIETKEGGPPSYAAFAMVCVIAWCAAAWYLGQAARPSLMGTNGVSSREILLPSLK